MPELFFYITFSSVAIMFASLVGVLFTWKTLRTWLTPRLPYLIAVASGVFIVIIANLLREIFHEGVNVDAFLVFLFGGILLELITRFLPKDSHHHHHGKCEHKATMIDARKVLIGDAVHNVHDGLTLVPAFLVSPVVGFGTVAGIFLHELVQEISEFFILKEAGYSTKKALLWNFAVSTTILIGVFLAFTVISTENITVYLVAFSAGGFSYILCKDLLPSVYTYAKKKGDFKHFAIAMSIGLLIMLTVTVLVPQHHNEDYEDLYPLPDGFMLA